MPDPPEKPPRPPELGGGWHGHRHARGRPWGPPPWWPQGEPFPPGGPEGWHGRRRHFLRRVGLAVALFFGFMFLLNAAAVFLFSRAFGEGDGRDFGPPFGFLAVGLLVAFLFVGRAVRRMARPVGDVMDAADRVASGDYTARVEERGSWDMRRLARSFNEMAERLQVNEDQRRALLADIAHELRTPLTVIRGNAEGILDGLYPADRDHLEPVLQRTRVMSRLLDDLQTLSTAEAGALRLHRERVGPADLVEEAVAAVRGRAEAAGVRLDRRVAEGLPQVEVDPVRIGEVLENLLQNALRHTPRGGSVTLAVGPADDGEAVAFVVSDTGPGIPPDVLPHVFDRFVKASDSGGAGLGLAIARSLVQAHGGEITAESRPGEGTTIRFVLPTR